MRILTVLSLVYAGVLVLALAVSLSLIAWKLAQIASVLKKVHGELSGVEEETRPVAELLPAINKEVTISDENVAAVRHNLEQGFAPVIAAAEKLGVSRLM